MIIDTLTSYKDNYVVLPITDRLLNYTLTSHHQYDEGGNVFANNDVPDYMEKEVSWQRDNKLDYSEIDKEMKCPQVEGRTETRIISVGNIRDIEDLAKIPETQILKGYDYKAKRRSHINLDTSASINDTLVEFVRNDEHKIIYNSHPLITNWDRPAGEEIKKSFIEVPKFQKGAPTTVVSKRKKDGKYSRQVNTPSHATSTHDYSKDYMLNIRKDLFKGLTVAERKEFWNPEVVPGSDGVGFRRIR